jgi:hypothetical protein
MSEKGLLYRKANPMRDINRLIIKAKQIYEPKKEQLIYVMIGCGGEHNTTCIVSNGISGQARYLESEHNTRDEALAEIDRISEEYPNRKDITVLDVDSNYMGILKDDV